MAPHWLEQHSSLVADGTNRAGTVAGAGLGGMSEALTVRVMEAERGGLAIQCMHVSSVKDKT